MIHPDPNAGISNLQRHVEDIWLIIFCFVCLQSMQNSFKHVAFVILIVLNKNCDSILSGRMLARNQCQHPSNSDWLLGK